MRRGSVARRNRPTSRRQSLGVHHPAPRFRTPERSSRPHPPTSEGCAVGISRARSVAADTVEGVTTVYLDESKSSGYTVVAAVVAAGDMASMRKSVAVIVRGGQRRIQFVKENDRRRREILSEFKRVGVRVTVYHAKGLSDLDARELCLTAIVADAAATGVDRIV